MSLWSVAVLASFAGLAVYGQRAGGLGVPPAAEAAGIETAPRGYTLVMAIHPKCPCTEASVYEMERLLLRCRGQIHARVLVYEPEATGGWGSDLVEALEARLPGVEVGSDPGGRVAAALGCETSGSVVLFDPEGVARFWGGITQSRGHAGDNLGADTITELVQSGLAPRRSTPVYGCQIRPTGSAMFCETGCQEDAP